MIIDRIALTLAIIGGINWGSIGLFRFDIVAWLFGGQTATVSRVVYIRWSDLPRCGAYLCFSARTASPTRDNRKELPFSLSENGSAETVENCFFLASL